MQKKIFKRDARFNGIKRLALMLFVVTAIGLYMAGCQSVNANNPTLDNLDSDRSVITEYLSFSVLGDFIRRYCHLNESARLAVRIMLEGRTYPNSLEIHCKRDEILDARLY